MQKNGAQSSSHSDRHVSVPNSAITPRNELHEEALGVELSATIVNVSRGEPRMLAIQEADSGGARRWKLPVIPYTADAVDGLTDMLRDGIEALTGLQLGYAEQLESELVAKPNGYDGASPSKRINVSYVALVSDKANGQNVLRGGATWIPLYDLLPWEDWRSGKPSVIPNAIAPKLEEWSAASEANAETRRNDVRVCFGTCQGGWDEEKVGERLAVLLTSDNLAPVLKEYASTRRGPRKPELDATFDNRDLLTMARALGRLRAQIKVKPIVFELVPDQFTLYELQQTVEAILGPPLHKQNFRRLVEHMGLVEPTGEIKSHTGGRPAQLFRFRPSVVLEHVHPGMRVRGARL